MALRSKKLKKKTKTIITIVSILVAVAAVVTLVSMLNQQKDLSWSQFVADVANNNVESVYVVDYTAKVVLKTPSAGTTGFSTRVPDRRQDSPPL